jgi:signal transduction histidine kinase
MNRIRHPKKRVLWILTLNGILVLIPISGFYFIQSGDYQSLFQRQVDLSNLNDKASRAMQSGVPENVVFELPVLAPYQRIVIVEKGRVADSTWIPNRGYEPTGSVLSRVSRVFLKKTDPPDLGIEEILSRLSIYVESGSRKLGIINYRYMYSVMPFHGPGSSSGSTIVLVDKSDIMRNTTLYKLILLLVTIVSGTIAIVISVIYYSLFVKPLFTLTEEALALSDHDGTSIDAFPLKSRNDEIGQLSQAFYSTASALVRRKEAVESFTSDVLHELKNPLTAIRNGIELLERNQDGNRAGEEREILEILSRESGRIEKLLYDIKELSRQEDQGNADEYCDPEEVIKEVASMYAEHGVKATIISTERVPLLLPKDKLARVLKNLVDNALDFSPEAGSVAIAFERLGNSAKLTVSDSGPGIPDGEKDRVYERFYSNRPDGKNTGLHSGLGLSIVKKILDDYGFTIRCLDKPPSGCRFEIGFGRASATML